MNLETTQPKGGFGRFMKVMSALDEKLAELAGWVVVVMMLTISYDVVLRYFFNAPTTWSFEINRYMLILVVFFGSGWTLAADGHVNVDILTDRLPRRKQQIMLAVCALISACYVLVFFIESISFTVDAWENHVKSTEYLAWYLWPIRGFLVVGSGMLFLECIFRIVRALTALRHDAA